MGGGHPLRAPPPPPRRSVVLLPRFGPVDKSWPHHGHWRSLGGTRAQAHHHHHPRLSESKQKWKRGGGGRKQVVGIWHLMWKKGNFQFDTRNFKISLPWEGDTPIPHPPPLPCWKILATPVITGLVNCAESYCWPLVFFPYNQPICKQNINLTQVKWNNILYLDLRYLWY